MNFRLRLLSSREAGLRLRQAVSVKGFSMKGIIALYLGFMVLMGWAAPGSAYDTMRCGNKLVSVGDPADKLTTACGPPTSVDEWEEERGFHFDPSPRDHYRSSEKHGNGYRVRKFVKVEVWTYNNGPNRFIEYVRLENGRIKKIENGGYGY